MAVVFLLAAAVFLNYVDRGNLATASPVLKDELGLSNAQIGVLLSAFFWSYAPLQPFAGWLAQRFDVRYVLAIGLVVWSMATALTALVTTFSALLSLRVLLGIGESVTYPCNSKFLGQRALEHERGRANGLIAASQALGPAFGTLIGGLVIARIGWRSTFIAFGVISLLWVLPWAVVTRGGTVTASPDATLRPLPYWMLLRQRALWGCCIGSYCSLYSYYFVLAWLPLFLVKTHGFSVQDMARIGAAVYALHAASSAVVGWLSDRWIIAGMSPNQVRKTLLVSGLLGVAAAMMASATAGPMLSVALLACAAALFGTQTPNLYALSQTLGGARAAGQWMGVQNLVGNLAGVTAPMVTGFLLDRTHEYFWAFAIAAGMALMGTFAFGILIPKIEPIKWQDDLRYILRQPS